jgi:CheY-like chemotaxis protein
MEAVTLVTIDLTALERRRETAKGKELTGFTPAGLPLARLDAADPRARRLLPECLARRHRVFPLREDDRTFVVATANPFDVPAERELELLAGRAVRIELAAPEAIDRALEDGYGLAQRCSRVAATGVDDGTILIVEDDPVQQLLERAVLSSAGFRVIVADDGVEALARLAEAEQVSLVVTDIDMPHMDGSTLLRAIRAQESTSDLPLIVLTHGTSADPSVCALMDAGADDYLRKPIEAARLIARVKAALRRAALAEK